MTVPVVCIDGPSGSGKGTVAMQLASILHWNYLDSGALYRILGYQAVQKSVSFDDVTELCLLARTLSVRFQNQNVYLDGTPVGDEIRTEQAGNRASLVAAIPEVRDILLQWQRDCAQSPGLIADGRDMGTRVFPSACCKIFLTASAEARAERRFNQLRLKGFDVTIRQLFEEISERDRRDAERPVSPLVPAGDAQILDTTDLTIDRVVEQILTHIRSDQGCGSLL